MQPLLYFYYPFIMSFTNNRWYSTFIPFLTIGFILLYIFSGCRKDSFIKDNSAKLEFSDDTLSFDTVFTTIGSATDGFLIYNNYNKNLLIDEISLGSGEQSYFRMNIDGTPAYRMQDVVIGPNDSIYVFIDVNIDPSAEALPFIIKDSVTFMTNGNFQDVKLLSWGQNAHFHRNDTIAGVQTWIDDLPHVIYGPVYIPESATLEIAQGVNIYCHPNGAILTKGSLHINGSLDSLVSFDGDRPEEYFADLPAQWLGIFLLRGENNVTQATIHYAVIDNALTGVSVGDLLVPNQLYDTGCPTSAAAEIPLCYDAANAPSCTITHTVIKNAYAYGILAMSAVVEGYNNLIYACGIHNFAAIAGGIYQFNHCSFANYGSSDLSHRDPTLLAINTLVADEDTILMSNLELTLHNCIITGSLEDELYAYLGGDNPLVSVAVNHCLLRTTSPTNALFTSCVINPSLLDSTFVQPYEGNYKLSALSKAIDAGENSEVTTDILGNARINAPDIGCYEYGY